MLTKDEMAILILQIRSDLSREALEEIVEKKKEEAGGLLTDEGATYIVANDLGVDLSGEGVLKTGITIKDLLVGASNVTITGTALSVYPARSFRRRDGSAGQIARIVIGDETGKVKVVLWDEQAEQRFAKEEVIRVNHGYVKKGLDGQVEVNVGRRGSVVVLSSNGKVIETKGSEDVDKKIREITEDDTYVNFVGIVREIAPLTTFIKNGNGTGRVIRCRVADETGRTVVVVWDEKTEAIQKAQKDDCIRIVNGRVRRGLRDGLEVHIGRESEVVLLDERPESLGVPPLVITKIGLLLPNISDIDVLARVTSVGWVKEFTRQDGKKGEVGEVFLMDDTGPTKLTLWNEQTRMVKAVSVGDVVLVEGAYTREGIGGVYLNLGTMGAFRVNPDIDGTANVPFHSTGMSDISELKVGFNASIRGKVAGQPILRTVSTADGRRVQVASLRIQDDVGEIRGSFWGDLANQFEELPVGTEIIVRNAYVKAGLSGEVELTSRSTTEVELLVTEKTKSDASHEFY